MNREDRCSRSQAVVTDTPQPPATFTQGNTFRSNSLPILGIGLVGVFAVICGIAINSPDFKGAIGFKITPHGLEFQLDRR